LDVGRYIARRLLLAIFVLLGVLVITFTISHSFGNPIYAWLGKSAALHPSLVAIYEAEYHLNAPVWVQFYFYVIGLAHGDLGVSPSRGFTPVSVVVEQTLPYTLQITFFAIIFALLMGFAFGLLAAFYLRQPIDVGIRAFYLGGYSSPPFFVGLLLLIVFAYYLHWLPSGGAVSIGLPPPRPITGIPMLDSLIEGDFSYLLNALYHVILPSLTLALTAFGVVTRILRSTIIDVMHSNFIRTARAKGLNERSVFLNHGLRNALIPVVTVSSLVVTYLLTGTVFVETIFGYPGMGQYIVQALLASDYPGILATTLIFALLIVLTNLAADILYVVVDPQIRYT
jgi:ABC-type dipeptide/oligopeptide/nickel transport system permease component